MARQRRVIDLILLAFAAAFTAVLIRRLLRHTPGHLVKVLTVVPALVAPAHGSYGCGDPRGIDARHGDPRLRRVPLDSLPPSHLWHGSAACQPSADNPVRVGKIDEGIQQALISAVPAEVPRIGPAHSRSREGLAWGDQRNRVLFNGVPRPGRGGSRAGGGHVDDEALAHIWPTHHDNVQFYGTQAVGIDGELAQLDADGYRPRRPAMARLTPCDLPGLATYGCYCR